MTPPQSSEEIDAVLTQGKATDEVRSPDLLRQLRIRRLSENQRVFALPIRDDGKEPDLANLSHTGWGIVFLSDEKEEVKAAFDPLIKHRRQQIRDFQGEAGEQTNDDIVKVLTYPVQDPPLGWLEWLNSYGVAPGSVIPENIPFYLLLIGDPARFSFALGHQLTTEYAVGRLHFESSAQYEAYVSSVIEYETAPAEKLTTSKEAVFFGPRHEFDPATQLSADHLITPLAEGEPEKKQKAMATRCGYRSRDFIVDAYKQDLVNLLAPESGIKTPAFLFTASHGMGFPLNDKDQSKKQGALLCQDWPGFGQISSDYYFSAADVTPSFKVHGMVIFHFACYGAGTPQTDRFLRQDGQPPTIANQPFIAELPKKWLTHPEGGALACLGHIERAWGYSIGNGDSSPLLQIFRNAIGRILWGMPVGLAMKDFYSRYTALATEMKTLWEKRRQGDTTVVDDLTAKWIECNDAEGYVLIGDPAVRLRCNDLI